MIDVISLVSSSSRLSFLEVIAMYSMMRIDEKAMGMTRCAMSELERSKVISLDSNVHVNVK